MILCAPSVLSVSLWLSPAAGRLPTTALALGPAQDAPRRAIAALAFADPMVYRPAR